MESDAYLDFAFFAWEALLRTKTPIENENSWEHVEAINWAANCDDDAELLAQRLAANLSPRESVGLFLTAREWRNKLENLMFSSGIVIHSEDGMDDFLYHLVGLGQSFVSRLFDDPAQAAKIAIDESYIESFKYVLTGTQDFTPSKNMLLRSNL